MAERNIGLTKALLAMLVFAAFIRLLGFVIAVGENSLQMDFSVYYTAGQTANAGLSVYKNYCAMSPPIWDGYDIYKHSRFLYPPLVATFFQPLALIPYHIAKYLWISASLAAIFSSVFLAFRASAFKINIISGLSAAFLVLVFHPLLPHLERGQIDAVVLFTVISGVYFICTNKKKGLAGALFALATLLKLHTVLLVPFIVLRRQWRVLIGYFAGGLAILFLSFVICGPRTVIEYAIIELPRISTYGESGTKEMLVEKSSINLRPPDARIVKDGLIYRRSLAGFKFIENASFVRTGLGHQLRRLLWELSLPYTRNAASLTTFGTFFGLISVVFLLTGFKEARQPHEEFLYWQLALVVILFSAPMTWTMNIVWLVTLFPFIVCSISKSYCLRKLFGLVMVSIGLLAATLPDHRSFSLIVPFWFDNNTLDYKYVLCEIVVITGLFLYLIPVNNNLTGKHAQGEQGLRRLRGPLKRKA